MGVGNADGGGSGAIRAGRAFVELFLDDSKVLRALENVKSRLNGVGNFFLKAGGGLFGAGSAVLAPLVGIFSESVYHLDELNKAADRLDTSTEALSKLGFAAKFAGLQLEDVETSAKHLEKNISEAASGSKEAADKFAQLGLSAKDLMGLSLDQQFLKIAGAMSDLANPADRVNAALGLFGKSGSQLLPLLKGGATGLQARFTQAEQLGFVTSGSKAEQATRFVDAFTLASMSLKKTLGSVALAFYPLLPAVEKLAERIAEGSSEVRKFVKENLGVIATVAAVGAGLVVAGSAVIGFGLAFKVAAIAIGGVSTAIGLIGSGIGFLLSPIGLVTTALVALGTVFATQTETGREMVTNLSGLFKELGTTFQETWGGIEDAIKKGDLELAFEIVGAGITVAWKQTILGLQKTWNDFVRGLIDMLKRNPWILPVAGAAAGGLVGGLPGAAIGAGAGAGAAVAVELFDKKINDWLSVDLGPAGSAVDAAKRNLGQLVDRAKIAPLEGEAADQARLKAYLNPAIVGKVKGAFATPFAAQQFGIGDTWEKQVQKLLTKTEKNTGETVKAVLAVANSLRFQ